MKTTISHRARATRRQQQNDIAEIVYDGVADSLSDDDAAEHFNALLSQLAPSLGRDVYFAIEEAGNMFAASAKRQGFLAGWRLRRQG